MKKHNTGFIISSHPSQKLDSYMGHATLVERRAAVSGGPYAEKMLSPNGELSDDPYEWMERTIWARNISEQIRAKNNPAYAVPKTFISHDKVREQFIDGPSLYELGDDFMYDNRNELVVAIGNFINDMSELYPVKFGADTPKRVNGIRFKSIDDLNNLLEKFGSEIGPDDCNVIRETFEFLRNMPENNEFVFSHNDLNTRNILINAKNRKVSVIDFELSGYLTKIEHMYWRTIAAHAVLWDYVNKLPRTTNPNLTWHFDINIFRLFCALRHVANELRKYEYDNKSSLSILKSVSNIRLECNTMEFILGQIKLHGRSTTPPTAALVHVPKTKTGR